MDQPLKHQRADPQLGRVLPELKVDPGVWPRIFILYPAAAVPTESWGIGSNWEMEMPSAVIVCGEMTLANVLPLSIKAAVVI